MGKLLARLLRLGRKTQAHVANGDDNTNDYRAVSIVPKHMSCIEARRLRSVRYLLREAPRLPLPQCPQRATCTCSYRKFEDRRTGDRRDIADSSGRWYTGENRRRSGGRRATDHHLSRIELTWPNKKS